MPMATLICFFQCFRIHLWPWIPLRQCYSSIIENCKFTLLSYTFHLSLLIRYLHHFLRSNVAIRALHFPKHLWPVSCFLLKWVIHTLGSAFNFPRDIWPVLLFSPKKVMCTLCYSPRFLQFTWPFRHFLHKWVMCTLCYALKFPQFSWPFIRFLPRRVMCILCYALKF